VVKENSYVTVDYNLILLRQRQKYGDEYLLNAFTDYKTSANLASWHSWSYRQRNNGDITCNTNSGPLTNKEHTCKP